MEFVTNYAVKLPLSVTHDCRPQVPLSRVELHVHLDGAVRRETLWDLGRQNGFIPASTTLPSFLESIKIQTPKSLSEFLSVFPKFMPAFIGDLNAIRRVATEFCEDAAKNGLVYVEARFCPHLLTKGEVKARHVVEEVCQVFGGAEKTFGIKARVILCCIIGLSPAVNKEVLDICAEFRDRGVVGIDIAGDEKAIVGKMYTEQEKQIFAEAKNLGIHRTLHAGEAGPAEQVAAALDVMYAERIGHGYHVLDDAKLYERCLREKVHFETCPSSSIMTGAVDSGIVACLRHPIIRFAKDNANFSLNTDDPTLTLNQYEGELDLVRSWGLSEIHIVRATFNAAKACFLPDQEKKELLRYLRKVYAVDVE